MISAVEALGEPIIELLFRFFILLDALVTILYRTEQECTCDGEYTTYGEECEHSVLVFFLQIYKQKIK